MKIRTGGCEGWILVEDHVKDATPLGDVNVRVQEISRRRPYGVLVALHERHPGLHDNCRLGINAVEVHFVRGSPEFGDSCQRVNAASVSR